MRTHGMEREACRSVAAAVVVAVGAAVMALLVAAPGTVAAGEEAAPPARAAASGPAVRLGAATGDPERDTVALAVRPAPAAPRPADAVRVGQGLRPDGTEIGLNEVPRPWLIRQ
ncbi:hypothetical protein [Azospirillum sp. ST 5-10]|uniref:hypothetical protein n=1 Tax=unclassified Azospirillum TaxID=2630922 RepID=UPI003F49D563